MARLQRQKGFFVEYLQADGTSRYQEHNEHKDEAMACARRTDYVTRIWEADGCAIYEEILHSEETGYFHIDVILFLINPRLIHETISPFLFEG